MPLSCNLGTLTSWNPLGHSRPVTGLIFTRLHGVTSHKTIIFTVTFVVISKTHVVVTKILELALGHVTITFRAYGSSVLVLRTVCFRRPYILYTDLFTDSVRSPQSTATEQNGAGSHSIFVLWRTPVRISTRSPPNLSGFLSFLQYIQAYVGCSCKNTHTRDAPQAQIDPNNMICYHTTTLSIHTTVVK